MMPGSVVVMDSMSAITATESNVIVIGSFVELSCSKISSMYSVGSCAISVTSSSEMMTGSVVVMDSMSLLMATESNVVVIGSFVELSCSKISSMYSVGSCTISVTSFSEMMPGSVVVMDSMSAIKATESNVVVIGWFVE